MSERVFLNGRVQLFAGDCLAVLPTLDENSVDSCVTDPPYALVSIVKRFGKDGSAPAKSNGPTGVYARASAGFMGARWDNGKVAFSPEVWQECARVMKPGAHLVAFGGTRTYHRLACAIEDAGFEIRDTLMFLYGSGFPKSHDVSKGIDRAAPRVGMFDKFAAHYEQQRKARGLTHAKVCAVGPFFDNVNHGGASVNWGKGHNVPTLEQWKILQPLLDLSTEWLPLIERVEAEREKVGERASGDPVSWYGQTERGNGIVDVTIPATDSARQWEGWGTALKPAHEPIVLARKPLSEKTVAGNVLRWGTGAINIDGCRVGTDDSTARSRNTAFGLMHNGRQKQGGVAGETVGDLGRWPANVIHDGSEEVVEAFPETETNAGIARSVHGAGSWGIETQPGRTLSDGNGGSAARFFKSCPITEEDLQWQHGHESKTEPAKSAGECLSLQSEAVVSALSNAVAMLADRLTLQHQSYRAPSTIVTANELRQICRLVTETIQSSANVSWPGWQRSRLTLSDNLASIVVEPRQIGTIAITISLLKSNGSAEPVTFDCTATNAEAGVLGSEAKRLWYTSKADRVDRAGSSHPTVKPLDLLQYLCRLITPPGGKILDCFAGTGTTGEAAWREGFSAVLIEREAEYIADIERRMSLCLSGPDERARKSIKARLKGKPEDHGPLFGGNSSSCVASHPHETGAADAPHGDGHTDHAGGEGAGGIAAGKADRQQHQEVGAAMDREDTGAPGSNGGAGQYDSGVRAA